MDTNLCVVKKLVILQYKSIELVQIGEDGDQPLTILREVCQNQ